MYFILKWSILSFAYVWTFVEEHVMNACMIVSSQILL